MSAPLDDVTLTPREIVAIYRAGIERGRDEATSYEWGTRAQGDELENLQDKLIWRDDVTNSDEARAAWWQAFMAAANA